MSDFDLLIADALERAYSSPEIDLDAGWADVLRRAQAGNAAAAYGERAGEGRSGPASVRLRPAHRAWRLPAWRLPASPRRRVALGLALLLAVALCGTALAATAGLLGVSPLRGFSEWLGVGPGTPASQKTQRSFLRQNAASVAHFPRGTKLRLLMREELGGTRYELLGFRSGRSLCLRLHVADAPSAPTCAPLRQLSHGSQPAHLLVAGMRVEGAGGQTWTVSYGLATDAVRGVEIVDRSGRQRALLAHNAFLLVARGRERPLGAIAIESGGDEVPIALAPRGRERPLGAIAIESGGDEVPIALAQAATSSGGGGYERFQPSLRLMRESTRPSGTLRWLVHRRRRGTPLRPEAVVPLLPVGSRLLFARQIRPDPNSDLRVGVALIERGGRQEICEILYEPLSGRLAGCARAASLFSRHYLVGRMLTGLSGGQGYVFVGLVSPGVAEVGYMHAGMDKFVDAPVRDGVVAIATPVSSQTLWLQLDGRPAGAASDERAELESGTWRPPRRR